TRGIIELQLVEIVDALVQSLLTRAQAHVGRGERMTITQEVPVHVSTHAREVITQKGRAITLTSSGKRSTHVVAKPQGIRARSLSPVVVVSRHSLSETSTIPVDQGVSVTVEFLQHAHRGTVTILTEGGNWIVSRSIRRTQHA